jgi:hypothetical protein
MICKPVFRSCPSNSIAKQGRAFPDNLFQLYFFPEISSVAQHFLFLLSTIDIIRPHFLLGTMPCAHVCRCAQPPDHGMAVLLQYRSLFKDIVTYDVEWVKDSLVTVSNKPGIGVEINEAGMKKYAVAGVPFFE